MNLNNSDGPRPGDAWQVSTDHPHIQHSGDSLGEAVAKRCRLGLVELSALRFRTFQESIHIGIA